MAQKINVPFVEDLRIGDSWQVVWAAVDPTTGAAVSGVVITNANVVAADLSGGGGDGGTEAGPYMLVPGPGA